MHLAEIVVDPLVWKVPLQLLAVVAVVALLFFIYIDIPRRMARNRHRDPLGWVLLSIFVSPLLTWIILLIVGDAKN